MCCVYDWSRIITASHTALYIKKLHLSQFYHTTQHPFIQCSTVNGIHKLYNRYETVVRT